MADYKSSHTGSQVDDAVEKVRTNNCEVKYGNLIGDIADQPDLQAALDEKTKVTFRVWNS